MDSVVIRLAIAEDIETIGQLWEQLVEHHTHLDTRLPESVPNGGRRYARRLYDTLRDDYARLLVAVVEGKVVGYVLGMIVDLAPDMFEQETSGFLADIFVAPHSRRTGAGRALVLELARWFRERGVQYYEWHVAARNVEALAFWQSVGGEAVMVRMRASVNE